MTGPAAAPRKPVILTVDDDPAVSRAVARDLRRHYGEQYRIVRAESGPDALETLNELKLRGDTVAVFVADYRMPQMSGIEFLEAAMDLFPMARRVLLTAYADTHAAIDAINVVDLDHYLLKPWDPPEEKLYPVIDGLLEAWRADGDRAIPHTKIIGHRVERPVLGGARVPGPQPACPTLVHADEPKGKQLLEAAGLDGLTLPVVITEQGEPLVEPTDAELAATAGSVHHAVAGDSTTSWSSAVAPPAWPPRSTARPRDSRPCSSSAPPPAVRPGRARGSRTTSASRTALSGSQLAERARRQAEKFEAELITARRGRQAGGRRVGARTDPPRDGRSIGARAVILATGRRVPAAARPSGCAGPHRHGRLLRRGQRRWPRNARTRRSTSSAARTRPARPRCSCRATAKSVTMVVRGRRWRPRCPTT